MNHNQNSNKPTKLQLEIEGILKERERCDKPSKDFTDSFLWLFESEDTQELFYGYVFLSEEFMLFPSPEEFNLFVLTLDCNLDGIIPEFNYLLYTSVEKKVASYNRRKGTNYSYDRFVNSIDWDRVIETLEELKFKKISSFYWTKPYKEFKNWITYRVYSFWYKNYYNILREVYNLNKFSNLKKVKTLFTTLDYRKAGIYKDYLISTVCLKVQKGYYDICREINTYIVSNVEQDLTLGALNKLFFTEKKLIAQIDFNSLRNKLVNTFENHSLGEKR